MAFQAGLDLQQAEHAALRILEGGDGAGFVVVAPGATSTSPPAATAVRTASATLETPK